MHTTYRMSAADLDERFLASVKSLFGANEVVLWTGRAPMN